MWAVAATVVDLIFPSPNTRASTVLIVPMIGNREVKNTAEKHDVDEIDDILNMR